MFLPHNKPKAAFLRKNLRHKKSAFKENQMVVSAISKNDLASNAFAQKPSFSSLVFRSWASISRRAKRQKKKTRQDLVDGSNKANSASTSKDEFINKTKPVDVSDKPLNDEYNFDINTELKHGLLFRGMDKLRRSFRKSFQRKKDQTLTYNAQSGLSNQPKASLNRVDLALDENCLETAGSIHNGKNYCQPDEVAVRSAACSFFVKYLGACEVFESRGMHVCENALQQLKAKKRIEKAILYVTGDGIRVVDQENNRGLILDQTIEKVSFCAPDRNDNKGFAYICRDGATKRWMCHGFQSNKESGERLSHAVGCAFTICLEKKRKRDAETAAYKSGQALPLTTSGGENNSDTEFDSASSSKCLQQSTLQNGSFRRQLSMTERKLDPQKAIINKPSRPSSMSLSYTDIQIAKLQQKNERNINRANLSIKDPSITKSMSSATTLLNGSNMTIVKPRPVANPSLFDRQGSFKAPVQLFNSFKRFNSLRTGLLTSCETFTTNTLHKEPIYEGDDENCSAELMSFNFCNYSPFMTNSTSMPFNVPNNQYGVSNVASKISPKRALQISQSYASNNSSNNLFGLSSAVDCANKADKWLDEILKTTVNPTSSTATASAISNNLATDVPKSNNPALNYVYMGNVMPCFNYFTADSLPSFNLKTPRMSHSHVNLTLTENISNFCGPPPNEPPPPLPPSKFVLATDGTSTNSLINLKNSEHILHQQNISVLPKKKTGTFNKKDSIDSSDCLTLAKLHLPEVSITKKLPTSNQFVPKSLSYTTTGLENGHVQKSSAARMSIEYQLLEETDVPPQSPPRNSPIGSIGSPLRSLRNLSIKNTILKNSKYTVEENSILKSILNDSVNSNHALQSTNFVANNSFETENVGPTVTDDPFDVKWSTEVLKKSAFRKSSLENPNILPNPPGCGFLFGLNGSLQSNFHSNVTEILKSNSTVITGAISSTTNPFFLDELPSVNV